MNNTKSQNRITLHFIGAAGTVTGSKHLLQAPSLYILIDCGLYQGAGASKLNREHLPIAPKAIDIVIVTHIHLDHIGYLPALVRKGFTGRVCLTAPTHALAEAVLRDSARLQEGAYDEEDDRSQPPLYTQDDVTGTLKLMMAYPDEEWFGLSDEVSFCFKRNGHVFGSAFVELNCYGKRIIFSGDLGRNESFMLEAPRTTDEADAVIIESTYGDRVNAAGEVKLQLASVINEAESKGGNLLIPSFAIGRAQELVLLVHQLQKDYEISNDVPLFLDTTLGIEATKALEAYTPWHRLSMDDYKAAAGIAVWVSSHEETSDVIGKPGSKIVIAGSGMLTGGKALHYLEAWIEDERNTILLAGYQAPGTLGRKLIDGDKKIKINGKSYRVKCDVRQLSLSGHADQRELVRWLGAIRKVRKVFLVHGEAGAAEALKQKIKEELGYDAAIPQRGDKVVLFNDL